LNDAVRPIAPIAAAPESLPASVPGLLDDLWSRIRTGLDGRWPPWALPTLATNSPEGPRARVLALRSVDAAARRFEFHTDARSCKVRELEADARVSLVFWDPHDAIEARFTGNAIIHCRDDIARTAWQNVSTLRRMASAVSLSPATALDEPARFDSLAATDSNDVAFSHFAVVHITATQLDWLWLGPGDMRRAIIRWTTAGYSASWAVP
jgi:pyridoxamine 5'-phosphate oxidase